MTGRVLEVKGVGYTRDGCEEWENRISESCCVAQYFVGIDYTRL